MKPISLSVAFFATCAHAATITFNNPTDLDASFIQNGGAAFTAVSDRGVNGDGSVATSYIDGTAVLATGEHYDFSSSGAVVTLRLSFLANLDFRDSVFFPALELGLVGTTDGRFSSRSAADYITVGITGRDSNADYRLYIASNHWGSVEVGFFRLSEYTYYELTANFENVGNGKVRYFGSVFALDAPGNTPGTRIFAFAPASLLQAPIITTDSSVFPAFRGLHTAGAANFDNFSSVPEPTSGSLLLFGAALYLRRRRH